MIIHSITLNNIRSYSSPQTIKLSTGVTLFEGDIGSGKSTILSAIEFALFGLGDLSGAHLLRHGEKTGSVLLEFSVNSKNYKVFRALERKRKLVSQQEGYIIEDNQKTDYSVTEMKTRILEILEFNERPKPKTSSLIYRYAIFTPQEMMKEVLFQPVERRLETLRRAFRVEDYSTVANNASIIMTWIDKEAEVLKRQTADIDIKKIEGQEEETRISNYESDRETLSNALELLTDDQKQILIQIASLQTQKDEVIKLQAELPHIKKNLDQKDKIISDILENITQLKQELEEIKNAEGQLTKIEPQYKELLSCRDKIEKLESSIAKIQELMTEKTNLQTDITNEKKSLEKQIELLQKNSEKIKKWLTKNNPETLEIPELEKEEKKLQKEVNSLPSISEKLTSLKQEQSGSTELMKLTIENLIQLNAELSDLKEIGIGAPCPKCKQKLTQKHYEKVQKDYSLQVESLENKNVILTKKLEKLKEEIEITSAKKKTLESLNIEIGKIKQKIAVLNKQKDAVKEKEIEYLENEHSLVALEKQLTEDNYSESERERLLEVDRLLKGMLHFQTEFDELKKRIKGFEKNQIEKKYHTNVEKISKKTKVIADITENENKRSSIDEKLEEEKHDFEEKMEYFESKKGVLDVIADLEEKKESLDIKIENKKGSLIAKRKDIENARKELKRITAEIHTREMQILKFDELKQYELWLSDFFIPAIKLIESHMLANINSEFNSLFQKWIGHLLETGDISVSVDDKFSPQILQSGYDMDVKSLSGGEKTAVALAYRLALNVMVKKVCDAMQSNLLILDEPTDGFSREQLARLRDILTELKCEQVIIVSHESELEGFVDNIFRVTKEGRESKILTS